MRTIKKIRVSQRSGTPNNVRKINQNEYNEIKQRAIVTSNIAQRGRAQEGWVETVTNVNGMKVIRRSRSISASRPVRSQISEAPSPSFPKIVDDLQTSSLLKTEDGRNFVKSGLFTQPVDLKLVYRGSRDGISAQRFHQLCDGKGATLTVLRSQEKGTVFGGFSDKAWVKSENGTSLASSEAFLFSLDRRIKFGLTGQNNENSVCCYAQSGPAFGKASSFVSGKVYYSHDLLVNLGGEAGTYSSSNLGKTFALPEGMVEGSAEAKGLLAGDNYFTIDEIEVYQVSKMK